MRISTQRIQPKNCAIIFYGPDFVFSATPIFRRLKLKKIPGGNPKNQLKFNWGKCTLTFGVKLATIEYIYTTRAVSN